MDASKILGIIYCFKDFPTKPYMIVSGEDPKTIYWKCSGGSGVYGPLRAWLEEVESGSIIIIYDPLYDGETS
jgi:hypothetical protein